MEIPNDLLQVIQDLLLDLRVHCLMVTLVHTTEGERALSNGQNIFIKIFILIDSKLPNSLFCFQSSVWQDHKN